MATWWHTWQAPALVTWVAIQLEKGFLCASVSDPGKLGQEIVPVLSS